MADNLRDLEYGMFRAREDKIVISASDSEKSAQIIIYDDNVVINSGDISTGIFVGKDGITLQGDTYFTGYGKSIRKANFSENPESAKIFTYSETISAEALVKEKLSEAANLLGIDINSLTKDGLVPLMTNISYGPIPHLHTMMFEHVHRVEPAYLHRVPGYVRLFKGFLGKFKGFLSS